MGWREPNCVRVLAFNGLNDPVYRPHAKVVFRIAMLADERPVQLNAYTILAMPLWTFLFILSQILKRCSKTAGLHLAEE